MSDRNIDPEMSLSKEKDRGGQSRRSVFTFAAAFLSGTLFSLGGDSRELKAKNHRNEITATATASRVENTRRLQRLIDSMPPGSTIDLDRQEWKIDKIYVNSPGLTICNGTVNGGPIQVGQDMEAGPFPDLEFNIRHVIFRNDSSRDLNAIEASCARGITVSECNFYEYKAVFYVRPQDFKYAESNHVARVSLNRLRVKDSRYVLHVPQYTSGGGAFSIADVQLIDCPELQVIECHVLAHGVDGVQIANNVMFMPGSNRRSFQKKENICITSGSFISISGNHLFEAGMSGIYLKDIQNAIITSNQIGFPGQVIPSPGIWLTGGDASGGNVVVAVISQNTVFMPTHNGISLDQRVGSTSIVGNVIHAAGSRSRYYGEAVKQLSVGIKLDPVAARSAALHGNMVTSGGVV